MDESRAGDFFVQSQVFFLRAQWAPQSALGEAGALDTNSETISRNLPIDRHIAVTTRSN